MTRRDKILNTMLSHPIIKEKYNFSNSKGIDLIGSSTDNLIVEVIRRMIKDVEINRKSNDEVVKTLLMTLNE